MGAKQAGVREECEARMRLTVSRVRSTMGTRDAERLLWLIDDNGARFQQTVDRRALHYAHLKRNAERSPQFGGKL